MANGNGKSVDVTQTHEEHAKKNAMKYVLEASADYRKDERRRAASILLKANTVEEFFDRAEVLMRGTWKDNVLLGASAISGLAVGYFAGRMVPWKVGPVPAIAAVGLAGVLPGCVSRETLTVRNILNLGGLLFMAGSWFGARK